MGQSTESENQQGTNFILPKPSDLWKKMDLRKIGMFTKYDQIHPNPPTKEHCSRIYTVLYL